MHPVCAPSGVVVRGWLFPDGVQRQGLRAFRFVRLQRPDGVFHRVIDDVLHLRGGK